MWILRALVFNMFVRLSACLVFQDTSRPKVQNVYMLISIHETLTHKGYVHHPPSSSKDLHFIHTLCLCIAYDSQNEKCLCTSPKNSSLLSNICYGGEGTERLS